MDLIETCRKFIAVDSSPTIGTADIARFAAGLCRDVGLEVELQFETLAGVEQANVIARLPNSGSGPEFLLQTHLDTVDPGSYGLWTKTDANPFNASIYQDKIYGLGAADVKLDYLCKLAALKELKTATFKRPIVLVGTFGEELGMSGAVKLIRKKKINAKWALVGEPSELRLIHSGKGLAIVDIEIPFPEEERKFRVAHNLDESTSTQSKMFMGKAAHSSTPETGESAISKMFEYLVRLPEGLAVMEIEGGVSYNTVPAHAVLEIGLVGGLRETISRKLLSILQAIGRVENDFAKYSDPSFKPAEPTLNIGMVRTFEDSIRLSGCCRLPPSVAHETYEKWMGDLRAACQEVDAVFRIIDYKPPFRTSLLSDFVSICQAQMESMGLDSTVGTQPATTEANVFSRLGIECLSFGPGMSVGNSHAPNEHVTINSLYQAIEFYKGVITKVCL